MEHAAKTVYYSLDHWVKMYEQQLTYLASKDPDSRQYISGLERMKQIEGQVATFIEYKDKTLCINNINFGLMLGATKMDLHRKIEKMFMSEKAQAKLDAWFNCFNAMQKVLDSISPHPHYASGMDIGRGRDYSVVTLRTGGKSVIEHDVALQMLSNQP